MRTLKIGLVAPEFPPDVGGIQTYSWHMADGLARLGHEVIVFTQPHNVDERRTTDFRVEPALALRHRIDRAIVRRYRLDVWHCMNAPHSWLALETKPVFVTVHGNDFLAPYHTVGRLDLRVSDRFDFWLGNLLTQRLVRRALPRAQHIFTNSRYTKDLFLRHHPACRGKTSVASVGVAEGVFAPHETPRAYGPARLITICRLAEREKNVSAVLGALAIVRREYDFHYTVVGDGELRPELEAMAAKLNLSDCVSFAGFVTPERKKELLCHSDLFIMPSVTTAQSCEGFGLVYLEANACGTPVLASRTAGAMEAVAEGMSGYFVEQPTVEALTSALTSFLSGEVNFNGNACQDFARRFSWKAVVDHCVAHYAEALDA